MSMSQTTQKRSRRKLRHHSTPLTSPSTVDPSSDSSHLNSSITSTTSPFSTPSRSSTSSASSYTPLSASTSSSSSSSPAPASSSYVIHKAPADSTSSSSSSPADGVAGAAHPPISLVGFSAIHLWNEKQLSLVGQMLRSWSAQTVTATLWFSVSIEPGTLDKAMVSRWIQEWAPARLRLFLCRSTKMQFEHYAVLCREYLKAYPEAEAHGLSDANDSSPLTDIHHWAVLVLPSHVMPPKRLQSFLNICEETHADAVETFLEDLDQDVYYIHDACSVVTRTAESNALCFQQAVSIRMLNQWLTTTPTEVVGMQLCSYVFLESLRPIRDPPVYIRAGECLDGGDDYPATGPLHLSSMYSIDNPKVVDFQIPFQHFIRYYLQRRTRPSQPPNDSRYSLQPMDGGFQEKRPLLL